MATVTIELKTRGFEPIWKILANRLNPFATRLVLPSITGVLLRRLEIGSIAYEPAQIAKADLYIRPDVEEIAYNDMKSIGKLVQLGYEGTRTKLADWKPSL